MTEMEKSAVKLIADEAADKLEAERAVALSKDKLAESCKARLKELKMPDNKNILDSFVKMRSSLIEEISRMLTRFCYQDEEFAREVVECKRTVADVVDEITKKVSPDKPQLSDIEAYAAAVQFYIPSAKVTVSFRISIPCELDDDLIGLGDEESGGAMILDLFSAFPEGEV